MKKALIPFITVLILTNTTAYCQETKPWSTKEKIEALSKFWAEARRNFVYLPQIGVQRWDSLYRENIQIALDSKTDWDFYCQMKRFCGFLQNGHTSIQADGIPWTTTAFRGMELQTMYAEGKIIVSGIDSLNSLRIPLGSEIVEIEGEPAIEYMKKNIVPLQATSTPHIQMRWAASSLFQGLHHTKHNIVIQTLEGKRIPLTLENYYMPYNNGRTFTLPGLKWTQNTKPFDFRMLDKKIAYVKIDTFQNKSVVDSFENNFYKISKAKGIIIDLRSNGGGSDHKRVEHIKISYVKKQVQGNGNACARIRASPCGIRPRLVWRRGTDSRRYCRQRLEQAKLSLCTRLGNDAMGLSRSNARGRTAVCGGAYDCTDEQFHSLSRRRFPYIRFTT